MPIEVKEIKEVKNKEVTNAVVTAKVDKDIADAIFNRVNEMEANNQLLFPANYAVGNALKSAYLIIQQTVDKNKVPVMQSCTKVSIANALLDMVIQGLNPAKKQCYFIAYGDSLDMSRSYFGDQVATMNALNIFKAPWAVVIYDGDEVEIGFNEEGEKVILSHKTALENQDKAIKGAYAIIEIDGVKHYEIMTWAEIQKSWAKSKMQNNSTQKDFPQEMAKRTVIRRLCKRFLNTSNDSNLMVVESYNRTTENEYVNEEPTNQIELQEEVDTKANQKPLIIEEPTKEVTPTDGPDF